MLPYLTKNTAFPAVKTALDEPNGLLAAGADLSSERLLQAYSKGIFPWYSSDEPILWWSPDPRTVFYVEQFKAHKSVKQTLRKEDILVTINTDFEQVIHNCSVPRSEQSGTWITHEMIQAYCQLHQQGHAHSVEVWQQEKLVGGIYGVATGNVFCGESMFSHISNGSKIALSCLILHLKLFKFSLIDCQIENPHLLQLGAKQISREIYLKKLAQPRKQSDDQSVWEKGTLNWHKLLGVF